MSEPTHQPEEPASSSSQSADHSSERLAHGPAPDRDEAGALDEDGAQETDLDRLARQVTGPDDHVGMAALWRVTMSLPHWWFIAVGEDGAESPAAAEVEDELLLLAFTSGERARDFAVSREMIGAQDDLHAIALTPHEVVESADAYQAAEIDGLIFDPHVSGYAVPVDQLGPVWDAVMSTAGDPVTE